MKSMNLILTMSLKELARYLVDALPGTQANVSFEDVQVSS